jgi:hypothetical protein
LLRFFRSQRFSGRVGEAQPAFEFPEDAQHDSQIAIFLAYSY